MALELETRTVHCMADDENQELTFLVLPNEKQTENHHEDLSGIQVEEHDSSTIESCKESENMRELSTVITDAYALAGEKFNHDLMHYIGSNTDNWPTYGYHESDSFSESSHSFSQSDSFSQCEDIESISDSTVTLTALNAAAASEATFSMTQPTTHTSLVDHNYYAFAEQTKGEGSGSDHLSVENQIMQQSEVGMDQEKLQRMKRRKEKNRECSRQFRLKQKNKEQNLMAGKIEKAKSLESTRRNVEKLRATLTNVAQQCLHCPKTAILLHDFLMGFDKENINPNILSNCFKPLDISTI